MTIQVTLRLPDELVHFMDERVAAHESASRAEFVARALKREQRRALAEHDAVIYAGTERDEDMTAMVEWTAAHPVRLDDDTDYEDA